MTVALPIIRKGTDCAISAPAHWRKIAMETFGSGLTGVLAICKAVALPETQLLKHFGMKKFGRFARTPTEDCGSGPEPADFPAGALENWSTSQPRRGSPATVSTNSCKTAGTTSGSA